MSLTQALTTASSGLKVTQSGMALIASNVANAQSPGYVRKTLQVTTTPSNENGSSVRVTGIQRELDAYLQKQLRVESAGGSYADTRSTFFDRLQQIYGDPSSSSAVSANNVSIGPESRGCRRASARLSMSAKPHLPNQSPFGRTSALLVSTTLAICVR